MPTTVSSARAVASVMGLPLRTPADGPAPEMLGGARALLHLEPRPRPCDAVWPLRALACGTPTVAPATSGLAPLFDERVAGVSVAGALASGDRSEDLAAAVAGLPPRSDLGAARRALVLGRHNRRAMAARYREIYSELVHGRR